jgi:hypothetical protein
MIQTVQSGLELIKIQMQGLVLGDVLVVQVAVGVGLNIFNAK